jgi:hypothetical protein
VWIREKGADTNVIICLHCFPIFQQNNNINAEKVGSTKKANLVIFVDTTVSVRLGWVDMIKHSPEKYIIGA